MSDIIGVTGIRVTVRDGSGAVLEKGNATRTDEDGWEFASHTHGESVIAEVCDLPEYVTKGQWHAGIMSTHAT